MGREQYQSQQYWDERYQSPDGYHEWYFSFETIEPLFSEHVTSRDAMILELGCGDAPLIVAMKGNGHNPACLHAIDFSDTIIERLNNDQALVPIPERVIFSVEDARSLSFRGNMFDVIIEKGTIDAMLCDKRKGFDNVKCIILEVCRLMKTQVATAFIMVSHMQAESDEFAAFIEKSFLPALDQLQSSNRWVIEAHTQESSENTHAVVYIISSSPRRVTRSSLQPSPSVDIQIYSHAAVS